MKFISQWITCLKHNWAIKSTVDQIYRCFCSYRPPIGHTRAQDNLWHCEQNCICIYFTNYTHPHRCGVYFTNCLYQMIYAHRSLLSFIPSAFGALCTANAWWWKPLRRRSRVSASSRRQTYSHSRLCAVCAFAGSARFCAACRKCLEWVRLLCALVLRDMCLRECPSAGAALEETPKQYLCKSPLIRDSPDRSRCKSESTKHTCRLCADPATISSKRCAYHHHTRIRTHTWHTVRAACRA